MNWLKQLPITTYKIHLDEPTKIGTHPHEIQQTIRNKPKIKYIEMKIQMKQGCYPIQQKARPIPYHLQKDVKKRTTPINEIRTLERQETVEEDYFVSPVVLTKKKTNYENRTGCPKTQGQLFEEKTTHAKNERITEPNICRIIQK